MQHATPATVLGDFDDARFSFQGVDSRFFRRDDRFFVRTDGPDGKLADFEVKYTFGVEPLQQYLVELPGGRLQALALSWDARPASAGGQRWFRQYPDEQIDHRDELHWTGRAQNWNFMCADCHSTDVRKRFDAAADTFDTRWSEISVGCEACHGPGSAHLAWSEDPDASDPSKGLTVTLDERRGVHWPIDPASGNAKRSEPRDSERELQVCAQCHSRRAQFAEGYRAGQPFHDHYLPSTIEEGLYHPDGQQRDEVFTWGSFRQSRMHQAGVTCSDCHEPHGQKLRAEGNAVCGQCHATVEIRRSVAPLPPAGLAGHAVRELPHAGDDLHGRGPATRSRPPRAAPRPDAGTGHTGCLHALPQRPETAMGRRRGGEVVRAGAAAGGAFRRGDRRRSACPARRRGRAARRGDGCGATGDRACHRDRAARALPGRGRATTRSGARCAIADAQVRHAAVSAQQAAAPEHIALVLTPLLGDPTRAVRMEAARVIAGAGALPGPDVDGGLRCGDRGIRVRATRESRPSGSVAEPR